MTAEIPVRCLYPFSEKVQSDLREVSPRLRIVFSPPEGQAQVDALRDSATEVLLSTFGPTDLSRLPALKWLATGGAGVNHLRLSELAARGVITTNASGLSAPPMAEFAIGGILLFSQRVTDRLDSQK